jgi:hypothetical protein
VLSKVIGMDHLLLMYVKHEHILYTKSLSISTAKGARSTFTSYLKAALNSDVLVVTVPMQS